MSSTLIEYDTIDFRPAPAGWTIFYFTDDQDVMTAPLAGWEIQAATRRYRDTYGMVPGQPSITERERVVTPVDMDGAGYMDDPRGADNFWMITGPGAPHPTASQIAEAWTAHHAQRDRERAAAAARVRADREARGLPTA